MSQIQAVKDATDIVALIGSRLSLQRSGSNFRGLCPFHSEKSPSFFVSETMQRYRCFGCGESGDVFSFLEKYEGMSFFEALESLAEAAGIQLEKHARSQDDEQREQLLAVLNLAKEYYHFLLTEHKTGTAARAYLKERGVTAESIKLFQLGVSPTTWDGLLTYLHGKKKYSLQLLEDAGLILKGKTGRYYDRFRNRLMFPLKNHRGQVVGFSGRLLSGDAKEAKYINSPETKLYHKSQMLFGYHELYQQIRTAKRVVVVEGEFDVISSAQAHVNEVVAIKGSALTEEHVKLLKRSAEQVLLALDTDAAGVKATRRAIEILQKHDTELRVIRVPGGKDPDELARAHPKEWREAVKQSVTAYEFLIGAALEQHDPSSPEGKRRIMQELAPVLAQLQHAVEREFYVQEIAAKLSVSVESVQNDIDRVTAALATGQPVQAAARQPESVAVPKKSTPSGKRERLEEYLLFLLLRSAAEHLRARASALGSLELQLPSLAAFLKIVTTSPGDLELRQLMQRLPSDLQQTAFEIYSDEKYTQMLEKLDIKAEWDNTLTDLAKELLAERKKAITEELSALDDLLQKTPAEEARQDELLRQLVILNTSLPSKDR
jgi:DNA primase